MKFLQWTIKILVFPGVFLPASTAYAQTEGQSTSAIGPNGQWVQGVWCRVGNRMVAFPVASAPCLSRRSSPSTASAPVGPSAEEIRQIEAYKRASERARAEALSREAAKLRDDEVERERFERDKVEALGALKDVADGEDLKDAVADPPSGDSKASRQQIAWKQVNCIAGIMKSAFDAREKYPEEFRFLIGQAEHVLDGRKTEVVCGEPKPLLAIAGRTVNLDQLQQKQKRMIQRIGVLAARLEPEQQARTKTLSPDEQRIQEVFRKQKQNESDLRNKDAGVVAEQKAINATQQRKYDPKDSQAIRREQLAKNELEKYVEANKNLAAGDPGAMIKMTVSLEDEPVIPRKKE